MEDAARGRLRLEPFERARARWRGRVERLLAQRPGALVLADVRACYGSIRGEVVAEALLRAGCHPPTVRSLGLLVELWESTGMPGLPVGPVPSAVLANAVLASVDREVAAEGCSHVRWVDDFVISAPDRSLGEGVLERLRVSLAAMGLRLAEEKCRIVEPDDQFLRRACRAASGPGRARRQPGGSRAAGTAAPSDRDLHRLESEADPSGSLSLLRSLRRLARARLGAAEADLMAGVATDPARHELVRAWAWRALASTDPRAALERAAGLEDEPSPAVRRAVAVSVAAAGGRRSRAFLRELRRLPDGAATGSWGLDR